MMAGPIRGPTRPAATRGQPDTPAPSSSASLKQKPAEASAPAGISWNRLSRRSRAPVLVLDRVERRQAVGIDAERPGEDLVGLGDTQL